MRQATYGTSGKPQGLEAEAEFRRQTIEEGRVAAVAAAYLKIPVQKAFEDTIGAAIKRYIAGDTSHDKLVGAVAELAALTKLMDQLDSDQTQGHIAQEKEYKHG